MVTLAALVMVLVGPWCMVVPLVPRRSPASAATSTQHVADEPSVDVPPGAIDALTAVTDVTVGVPRAPV